jgi:spore germination protein KC
MKPRVIIGLMIIFCLCQTGCWSRKELNQLSIILAEAIDRGQEKDKIIQTIQIANPTAMGKTSEFKNGFTPPFYLAASSGFTLADAERNLYKHVTRPPFWQHRRVVIISEEFARNHFNAVVDYLDRIIVYRRKMLLLITPGPARDVLAVGHPIEKLSGKTIYYLTNETSKHSEAYYPSDIDNFLITLATPGIQPVLARIQINRLKTMKPETGQAEQGEGQPVKFLELSGSAVFRATRMVGWLNEMETRGLLWVQGKTKNTMLVIKCRYTNNQTALLTLLNQRTSSKIIPELLRGKLRLNVVIKAEGRSSGLSNCTLNPVQTNNVKYFDRQYARAIKREVRLALAKAQNEYRADIFGFGLAVSRKYPQLWKKLKTNWDEKFSGLKVNLKVTAHVRRLGLAIKPTTSE